MYQIQAVANGWIVQPIRWERQSCAAPQEIYVFNNFDELSQWLERAVVLPSKVD
jgi:hypothetical protein